MRRAQAWIDHEAGYGVYLVVEEGGGSGLKDELEPMIDELIAG